MSDLAYFEYALVLPEERYLIEVQTRKPESGELRTQKEIDGIAKECLASVIGQGHEDEVKEQRPQSDQPIQCANVEEAGTAFSPSRKRRLSCRMRRKGPGTR